MENDAGVSALGYLQLSESTESFIALGAVPSTLVQLIHAEMGLQTETGEFTDMLKKHLFYNKPLDRINALEEMGDILWYMAIVLRVYQSTFEDVMTANIAKLQLRYGDKFDEHLAAVRNLDQEREVLEALLPLRTEL